MLKFGSVFLLLLIMTGLVDGQQKYWAFFTDKKGVVFDPFSYFDQKAIERRFIQGLPLFDSTDFPLNDEYISTVVSLADSTGKQSRWFNGIIFYGSESTADRISQLPFVKEIAAVEGCAFLCEKQGRHDADSDHLDLMRKQTGRMQSHFFTENKLDGKGIRIAILDGGFPGVDKHPVFEHLRRGNQIVKTWDFVKDKEFVYGYMKHGTMVLSCIAGIYDGIPMGLATGAEFLLARTEVRSEPFSEEENWLAAAEWADKNGADIINSSLGYTYHRYFPQDMDGKKSLVVRAANMAAAKGILVVNAAGNDGDNSWKKIGTPADADSVLAVGGIAPQTDYHIAFSSFGPTADMRPKPNVAAFGHAVTAVSSGGITEADGTSFASPLVAGFAACAWQSKRNYTNMQMFHEIEQSADLYPYFDYAHGYGVPQAGYFVEGKKEVIVSFRIDRSGGEIIVETDSLLINDKKYNDYLYWKIADEKEVIGYYEVVRLYAGERVRIDIEFARTKGKTLHVFYKGYYQKFNIE